MIYRIINKTKNTVISANAAIANNFWLRLKGLMFKRTMGQEEALIFYRCTSIHTFFMRFPIDVVFLDRKGKVFEVLEAVKPARVILSSRAFITMEFPPHKISKTLLEPGDSLEILPYK